MNRSTRTRAVGPGVVAVLVLAAVILGGHAAGTFTTLLGRAQTVSGAAYELHTVRGQDGRSVVARWNPCQDAVTYQVNLAGIPAADRAATTAEITAGIGELAAATGMSYRYTGTTTFIPTSKSLTRAPAELVIAAVGRDRTDLDGDASTLGFGGIIWTTWNRTADHAAGVAVVRGYVVLDPESFGRLKAGFGAGMSQGNVILHELGHATGLEHPTGTGQLMDATLTTRSPAGYRSGDRAGLAELGRTAGCITVPTGAGLADLD